MPRAIVGPFARPERRADRHAQHLSDRAPGQAMERGAERHAVDVGVRVVLVHGQRMVYRRPVRFDTSALVVVAMAAVTTLALPDGALADHSTAIQPFGPGGSSVTVAGCQAKGLRVSAAPKSSGAGLAAATYLYTVSAVLAGGETPACLPLAVTTTVSDNSAVLQWNAAPGALGYRVYRSDSTASPATLRALLIGPGNTVLPPNVSPGGPPCPTAGRADKCVFQDNGGPQDPAQAPTVIAQTAQGGAHADVNLVQTIDYGGDTFDSDQASTTASPQVGRFHLPPGFVLSPSAAPTCKLAGAAPSLIGDPAIFGSDDPDEDTCPNSTLVGTMQALAVTASGPSLVQGDIYNGATQAGEVARLFIVLRPLCSAGNLVASPGSASCNASLGGADREVEKAFLAGVATMVDRGGGVLGLDVDTVEAETGGPIAPYLNLLVPTPALARVAKLRLSLRQMTPHLFGVADQGTASTADDQPFVTLPIFCGVQSLSGEITTYTDTTPATGSTPISVFPCEQPPADTGDGGSPPPPGTTPPPPETAFGTATLVTLRLAAKRIPARGPVKVRVANANGFAITGALSARTVDRVSVSRLRRIKLSAKAISVAAQATRTVKLVLPSTLRRVLARKHKLTLRLTAKVNDPAGNTRTVRARVSPRLKRPG